jgi:hypothetical protein
MQVKRRIFMIKDIIDSKYKVLLDNNHETMININNHILRFIKSSHKYFIDGVEVPPVSQIIKYNLLDIYKDIDKKIINIASQRGEFLHLEIENYEKNNILGYSNEFKNYLKIKEKYHINSIKNELFIIYMNGNVPFFAGRLDLLYSRDDKIGILDFKRTRDFHEDRVRLQLNLYKMAFTQSFGIDLNELACIRLREEIKEFIPIKIDMLESIDAIDSYKMRKNKK